MSLLLLKNFYFGDMEDSVKSIFANFLYLWFILCFLTLSTAAGGLRYNVGLLIDLGGLYIVYCIRE